MTRLRTRVRTGLLAGANWTERRLFPTTSVADDHWVRTVMNQEVDRFLSDLPRSTMTCAEISGDSRADRGWAGYESLMYPEFDVCAPVTTTQRYDVVLCEQVLEHVLDPWEGVANLARLCAPGGYVVITSPFLIKVHELPMYGMFDYWRFTPRGLRLMVERVGLDVVDEGQWGNRMAVTGNLTNWSARRRWHPMRNEPDVPVQIWCVARRPVGATPNTDEVEA